MRGQVNKFPPGRFRKLWLDPALTIRQIADTAGYSDRSSAINKARALGLPSRAKLKGRPAVIGDEHREKFTRMWLDLDVPFKAIYAEFATYQQIISNTRRRFGLPSRDAIKEAWDAQVDRLNRLPDRRAMVLHEGRLLLRPPEDEDDAFLDISAIGCGRSQPLSVGANL